MRNFKIGIVAVIFIVLTAICEELTIVFVVAKIASPAFDWGWWVAGISGGLGVVFFGVAVYLILKEFGIVFFPKPVCCGYEKDNCGHLEDDENDDKDD